MVFALVGEQFGFFGSAVIIGIHLGNPTTAVVTVLSLVSIGAALLVIRLAGSFLPASDDPHSEVAGQRAGAVKGSRLPAGAGQET